MRVIVSVRELRSGFCIPPNISKVHIFKIGGGGPQITPAEKILHEVGKTNFWTECFMFPSKNNCNRDKRLNRTW